MKYDNRCCPTCGHMHPGGAGTGICGCEDCSLVWSPVPRHLLSPAYRERLVELDRAMQGDTA